jgi:hypothetical protein
MFLLWLYSPLLGLGRFFSFFFSAELVGLLGQGISPSLDLYLNKGPHKHRINPHNTDIHTLSWIWTHDPNLRANEDSSWLRPHGPWDRLYSYIGFCNCFLIFEFTSWFNFKLRDDVFLFESKSHYSEFEAGHIEEETGISTSHVTVNQLFHVILVCRRGAHVLHSIFGISLGNPMFRFIHTYGSIWYFALIEPTRLVLKSDGRGNNDNLLEVFLYVVHSSPGERQLSSLLLVIWEPSSCSLFRIYVTEFPVSSCSSTLSMEEAHLSEMLPNFNQSTPCHII